MASNQDILEFLREEKESRKREKELEKESRAKERQEDFAKMAELIRQEVREEVRQTVNPLEERLMVQEKTSQDLGDQMKHLLTEFKALKDDVNTVKDFPALPNVLRGFKAGVSCETPSLGPGVTSDSHGRGGGQGDGQIHPDEHSEIREICNKARKIIGFKPIEPRMLEIQMISYGAKNLEEAMLMEVKSYLKCEMKVKPWQIDQLNIVRIFPPAREDWDTLYVEFDSEYEVDLIYRHTRVMTKQDHNVVRWYPKELFERFQALDSISYKMREDMKMKGSKLRTKVTVGRDDLVLSTKSPGGRWKSHPLPEGIPRIDLAARGRASLTASPPPGRPRLSRNEDARKRQFSGSDHEKSAKKVKNVADNKDEQQQDGMANKEGEQGSKNNRQQGDTTKNQSTSTQLDPGSFTNLEAYSPKTPAKAKQIPDLPVIVNSPVFHTKPRETKA